jgi:futalosine hydrolase
MGRQKNFSEWSKQYAFISPNSGAEGRHPMNSSDTIGLAILGAVHMEMEPFFQLFGSYRTHRLCGESFRLGEWAGRSLIMGTTGIGKVNAAVTTAALLERFAVDTVVNVGCAGAYSEGPLRVGDVLVTQNALCGDEGILTIDGIHSSREMGFPLLLQGEETFYDAFPMDRAPLFHRVHEEMPEGLYRMNGQPLPGRDSIKDQGHGGRCLHESCSGVSDSCLPSASCLDASSSNEGRKEERFRLVYGPSLTVGMVSGDAEVAHARFSRYEAFAENMEGSAVAQTCFRFDVPVMECRGISNMAGDRDKKNWELGKAMFHCRSIVLNWLRII